MITYQLTHENYVYKYDKGVRTTIPIVDSLLHPNKNTEFLIYKEWLAIGNIPLPADELPEEIPYSITPAQGKTVLLQAGYWDAFNIWINSLEGAEKLIADIAISSTQSWNRDSPFLLNASKSLGISSEELDRLFIEASKIIL